MQVLHIHNVQPLVCSVCDVMPDCYDSFAAHYIEELGGEIIVCALSKDAGADCNLEDIAENWIEKLTQELTEHIKECSKEYGFSGTLPTLNIGLY